MDLSHQIDKRLVLCLAEFRDLRKYNPRHRPFAIELLGTPKSGKTTTAEAIEHSLKRNKWKVTARPEGATVVDRIKRDTPHYNLQTCRYALSELADRVDSDLELVILDRGLMDGMVWMDYWLRKKKLSESDYAKALAFYGMDVLRDQFDLHVFLVCEPAVALQRELARRRDKKDGETMNPKSLQTLHEIHDDLWKKLGGADDPRMARHDSSKENEEQTLDAVLLQVVEAFERRLKTLK